MVTVGYNPSTGKALMGTGGALCIGCCGGIGETGYCPACFYASLDEPYYYNTLIVNNFVMSTGVGCFDESAFGNHSISLHYNGFFTDGIVDRCFWVGTYPLGLPLVKGADSYTLLKGYVTLEKYRANNYFTTKLEAFLVAPASTPACDEWKIGEYSYTHADTKCMTEEYGTASGGAGCITTYGTLQFNLDSSAYPRWGLCQSYSSGVIVLHNGTGYDFWYECLANHTANSLYEPGVGTYWTTYWRVV
jgi:hypothetical protein